MPRTITTLVTALLFALPLRSTAAQLCAAPLTRGVETRAAAGLEWGGEGYARGTTLSWHGRRAFVAGEFTDRGWGNGRRQFEDAPLPGFMERQHQVLGVRAGIARALGGRTTLCTAAGFGVGTGLSIQPSGDPQSGGVGFESHRRFRADIEVVRRVAIGSVDLLPSASVGLLFFSESELSGDIMLSGLVGYLPITFTLGVPVHDRVLVRPRLNVPRGDQRGTSYGLDVTLRFAPTHR
jgi:hypothetical protein